MSKLAPTRVAVVEETIAEPKDIEVYKAAFENVILIGSGTYGSVYYIRQDRRGRATVGCTLSVNGRYK